MGQGIDHQRAVLGILYRQPAIGMVLTIQWRTPDPERNLHLVAGQTIVDIGPMHPTVHIGFAVEDLLTMVGHIDHHGILICKPLCDSSHDRVVVAQRIVVLGQDLLLFVSQLRPVIHLWGEVCICLLWITGPIVHMRSHQMQDHQVMLDGRIFQGIVFLQHPIVETMCLGAARIKLPLTQFGVVQEKAAAEVIDSLLGLGLKLVGDEGHVIACLAEHLREEWLVAPLPTVADGIER